VAVLCERAQVLGDARRQRVPRISVVMQVKLDFTESGSGQLGEPIEEVRAVLLAGKEPAVARRPAIAVAELAERRVALGPHLDPLPADVVGGLAPQRLVVIAEREQEVLRICWAWRTRTANEVSAVIANPVLKVLFTEAV
jgi:hypothetical protein